MNQLLRDPLALVSLVVALTVPLVVVWTHLRTIRLRQEFQERADAIRKSVFPKEENLTQELEHLLKRLNELKAAAEQASSKKYDVLVDGRHLTVEAPEFTKDEIDEILRDLVASARKRNEDAHGEKRK